MCGMKSLVLHHSSVIQINKNIGSRVMRKLSSTCVHLLFLLKTCHLKLITSITVRWIVFLVSFFQSQYSITDRAIAWLLKFLYTLLKFLGYFSTWMYTIADKLPRTIYKQEQHFRELTFHSDSFQKRVVCKKCWALYTMEESKLIHNCSHKPLPRSRHTIAEVYCQP